MELIKNKFRGRAPSSRAQHPFARYYDYRWQISMLQETLNAADSLNSMANTLGGVWTFPSQNCYFAPRKSRSHLV